jgi:cyclomaltodextrinase
MHWSYDTIFYHIYPLGFCGAPGRNDFCSPPTPRLERLYDWLDHVQSLGANALYLGPIFESSAHGYDTADYYHVDRRLGSDESLSQFSAALHQRGMRLVLDGVFNHVGRDFWAFQDLLERREASAYRDWFHNLHFDGQSPYGDPFRYEGWSSHYDLVKLNLHHPDVKAHLFQAVEVWVREFGIDGLRLDAADCIDPGWLRELAAWCKKLRPDFWLMGEVVHGDYRRWANAETLDSVTNYECYKGLYSSHVDKNYFEIAYALNRQFGEGGLYRGLPLYAFADNHDVNRVASSLADQAHLYPLYSLLFTMPGVPSIYYGSEWGIEGKRHNGDDRALRPQLDLGWLSQSGRHRDLAKAIARLAQVRRGSAALQHGSYRQLFVGHEQLAFARQVGEECVIVAVNAAGEAVPLELDVPVDRGSQLVDLLNEGERFDVRGRRARIELYPCWARVMAVV